MKRVLFLTMVLVLSAPLRSQKITYDPELSFAIVAQIGAIKEIQSKKTKEHTTIQGLQFEIQNNLSKIHSIESQMLDYLGNASGALQNLVQIKHCAELIPDIVTQLETLAEDVPDNIKGTAVTAAISKLHVDVYGDIIALGNMVTDLVTSKYSLGETSDKSKVNLLSAAERFHILSDVEMKLIAIRRKIHVLDIYIRSFGWRQLLKGFDRKTYFKLMSGEVVANRIKKNWGKLTK